MPRTNEDEDRQVSPLFAQPTKDNGYIYADQIARIALYRQTPGRMGGPGTRKLVSARDYEREDGSYFEFSPFETTDQEIEEQFGGGEYWIEAYGHNGKVLPGGHTIMFDSGPRGSGKRGAANRLRGRFESDDEDDENEPEGYPNPGGFPAPFVPGGQDPNAIAEVLKSQQATIQSMKDSYERMMSMVQTSAAGKASDAMSFAEKMLTHGGASSAQHEQIIAELRRQLDELRRQYNDEMRDRNRGIDDLRDQYNKAMDRSRDERDKLTDRHHDELKDLKDEHREEISDLRDRHKHEITELRDTHRQQLDEERRRRQTEVDDTRVRLSNRITELEKTLGDTRRDLETRNRKLEEEVFKANKELASVPLNDEPPPPSAPTGPMPDGAPWWAALAGQAVNSIGQVLQSRAATNPAGGPPNGVPAAPQLGGVPQQQVPFMVVPQETMQPIPMVPQPMPQAPMPTMAPAPAPMPNPMPPVVVQPPAPPAPIPVAPTHPQPAVQAAPQPSAPPPAASVPLAPTDAAAAPTPRRRPRFKMGPGVIIPTTMPESSQQEAAE